MSWIAWKLKEKDKRMDEKINILFNLVNIGETTPTIENVKKIEVSKELRPSNWKKFEGKVEKSVNIEALKIIF